MDRPATALCLPASLPFPLTIHRLLVSPSSPSVSKTQPLLTYSYTTPPTSEHPGGERSVGQWESPVEGQLVRWDVQQNMVCTDPDLPVVHIREPCTHDVQWDGMCAVCGKDLTNVDYTGFSDTARATISMVHDVGGLTVSMQEAHRLESATTTRLLESKKLSLIVDLDQTIVHATVDPTVGEWLQDPSNPNYRALEGVQKFKLGEEGYVSKTRKERKRKASEDKKGTGQDVGQEAKADGGALEAGQDEQDDHEDDDEGDGCWYYIKMRPGLPEFLKSISEIYEMHVYTMGTRAYAKEVCKVIDPDGGLFGGRILSRDESGSMTRKSLQRLFPCDTNMVVIIDDRADVWDGSPNLVKVIPYEFFVGIGDINAAFLPKKKDLVPPPVSAPPDAEAVNAPADSPSSTSAASDAAASASSGGADEDSGDERSRITTTPPTSPPDEQLGAGSTARNGHHETTVDDLLVNPSPTTIVSPSLSEASSAQAEDISHQIHDRPLQRIADESHLAHLQQHQHDHPSKSPSPASRSRSKNESSSERTNDDLVVDYDGAEGVIEADQTGEANTTTEGDAGAEEDIEEEAEEEAVLKDDDRELDRVYKILSEIHETFFREHEKDSPAATARIIPSMKRRTLESTHLVFSGLVALGSRPQDSEYWKLAETFGARCSTELRGSVTHLVANQPGTAKVHSARRNPRISIVYPQWLLDSIAHWTRLDEGPYLIPDPKQSRSNGGSAPGSPVRPELSDGEGDDEARPAGVGENGRESEAALGGGGAGPDEIEDVGELNMGEMDWGEAMAEMDDLLNETDDDGTEDPDDESDAGVNLTPQERIATGMFRLSRKRARLSAPNTDDESDGGSSSASGPSRNGPARRTKKAPSTATATATESPLQKRVKTARSRSSGLKTSLSAAALAAAAVSNPSSDPASTAQDEPSVRVSANGKDAAPDASSTTPSNPVIAKLDHSAEPSQASSSIDSDDEGFLASMAAELEAGFDAGDDAGDDDV
ncbi:hypothetical protein JCM10212_002828 [Sporobolomyces blumeae]